MSKLVDGGGGGVGGPGLGLEITELRLGLPGGNLEIKYSNHEKKRVFSELVELDQSLSKGSSVVLVMNGDDGKNKSDQVAAPVGWPPVCSYRIKKKNIINNNNNVMYVKVSMDGAPFLRKIDLSIYKDYAQLAIALEKLFGCAINNGIAEALNHDADYNYSEYVPIYEDKDGDWMLVGDVPWEMFSESCKRLRIMMKPSDQEYQIAKGVGLRARDFLKDLAKMPDN